MSEAVMPVSALRGASFEAPDVSIRDRGPVGMVTIRGDFASKSFAAAVKSATGCDLPDQRKFVSGPATGLGWMAPDELLCMCDYAAAPGIAAAISDGLKGEHHMALAVSDARSVLDLKGPGARELIAKGAPVDLSPEAFGPGDLRRTRLGQVAAAFWLGEDGAFTLVSFRSVGSYVFDWLTTSAADGARPGLF